MNISKEELEKALIICYTNKQLADYFHCNTRQISYHLNKYSLKPLMDSHSKDERGNVYNKLTVIDFAGRNHRGEILWNCICECGKETIRSGAELRRPRSKKMCVDCAAKLVSERQFKNHADEIHGHLTVLKPTRKDLKTGNIFWLCQCDCGNQIEVRSFYLNYNSPYEQLSCGCQVSNGEYHLNKILNKYKINYKTQFQINDCRSSISNYPYKFDFAIFDQNDILLFLIEYNGKQHYESNQTGWNTEEHFEKVHFRDTEKEQYCINNNIPLLIIPYTVSTEKDIEKKLLDFIQLNHLK